jgi:hypothetical protein
MVSEAGAYQPEFVLPRLQKKQCYQIVSIIAGFGDSELIRSVAFP